MATVGVSSAMYAFSPCGACVRVFKDDNTSADFFINDECTTCSWGVSHHPYLQLLPPQKRGMGAAGWDAV